MKVENIEEKLNQNLQGQLTSIKVILRRSLRRAFFFLNDFERLLLISRNGIDL
jgi:hypothetical protein